MTIHITEAPAGTIPHRLLADRIHPDRQALLVQFPPREKRPGGVALDLLQAMGKDFRVVGANSVRNDEHRLYAPMWAVAHGITTVAVLDAQQTHPRVIGWLLDLLPATTTTVLVCEPGHAATAAHRFRDAGITPAPLDWDTWLEEHPKPSVNLATVGALEEGYNLDHLPKCDFLTFRYACRERNTTDRFQAIDSDYVRVYGAAQTVMPDEPAVISHLDAMTAAATSTASMLVAIRATQSAFFARGHLLRAHPDRLLGVLSCTKAPRPTDDDWRALRAYIRPERAATTTLYLLGVAANALNSTTVEAVHNAMSSGRIAGRTIPDLAKPLLAAQLVRREHEEAAPADSYLNLNGERRHLEILIAARRAPRPGPAHRRPQPPQRLHQQPNPHPPPAGVRGPEPSVNDQPTSLFDVATIRTALQQSGLAPSELAFRVDFAVRSLQRILNGDPDPGEIRVATLARLANHLGLPLRSLIAAPPATTTAVDAEATPEDEADDAATVTALLYDREAPTLNDDLAEALGWSLDRLHEALTEADRRLRPAGLRIVREHGESRVQPLHDHPRARRDLTQVRAHRSGLKPYEYQATYLTYTGQQITAPNETRRRVITGGLANAGVLDLTDEEPALSAAAAFAHP